MAQDGRLEEAIGVWQSLAEDSPPGSPWPELLQEQIARAAGELGIEPPTIARPEEPGPRGPTAGDVEAAQDMTPRSEEHTSELQSLMRISYAVFCLKKKTLNITPSTAV